MEFMNENILISFNQQVLTKYATPVKNPPRGARTWASTHKKSCLNCDKNEKFHLFSEHHVFFKIFSVLSNWNVYISENDEKKAKTISFSCKKTEKNDIFLAIFTLLSDYNIKLCFLVFFDTKLSWQFLKKFWKFSKRTPLNCMK